ncbi:MAG: hypothetical protein NC395_10390 [Prevotella sp.]|nr:hypothetical protein [Prevotella sp.]
MMYPYMTLSDETEVVHSHLIDGEKVVVHFERPTEEGFLSARFELPSYRLLSCEGYSREETDFFKELLRHNAHLIYKYAECGGVKIA